MWLYMNLRGTKATLTTEGLDLIRELRGTGLGVVVQGPKVYIASNFAKQVDYPKDRTPQ